MSTFMRPHAMSDGRKYIDHVDVFYEREGVEHLIVTIHIDSITDIGGLPEDAISRLKAGDCLPVRFDLVTPEHPQ